MHGPPRASVIPRQGRGLEGFGTGGIGGEEAELVHDRQEEDTAGRYGVASGGVGLHGLLMGAAADVDVAKLDEAAEGLRVEIYGLAEEAFGGNEVGLFREQGVDPAVVAFVGEQGSDIVGAR